MAWCCQSKSHCLSQCWPRFMSPYGVTRPQWVNFNASIKKVSNYIIKVGDEITYWFPNFSRKVWEWKSNFIPQFTGHILAYPCWDLKLIRVVKGDLKVPCVLQNQDCYQWYIGQFLLIRRKWSKWPIKVKIPLGMLCYFISYMFCILFRPQTRAMVLLIHILASVHLWIVNRKHQFPLVASVLTVR